MSVSDHSEIDDKALLILSGHQLVEVRLRDILARICREPEELKAARLTFDQAWRLCCAVRGGSHEIRETLWASIERLDEARNKIEPSLDPGSLDELIVSVSDSLLNLRGIAHETSLDRFRMATIGICSYLDSVRGSVHLVQAYQRDDSSDDTDTDDTSEDGPPLQS